MPAERDQADRIIREGPAGRPNLQEHIVLALMVIAKWDHAYDQFGADPTPDEVAGCDAFTDREVQAHRDTAGRMVTEMVANLLQPDPGWTVPVAQGVLAAFIYSLLLICTAAILHYSGVDLLGVLEKFAKPG